MSEWVTLICSLLIGYGGLWLAIWLIPMAVAEAWMARIEAQVSAREQATLRATIRYQ